MLLSDSLRCEGSPGSVEEGHVVGAGPGLGVSAGRVRRPALPGQGVLFQALTEAGGHWLVHVAMVSAALAHSEAPDIHRLFTSMFIRSGLRPASLAGTSPPAASRRSPRSLCRPGEEGKERAGGAQRWGSGQQENTSRGRKWRPFRTQRVRQWGCLMKGRSPRGGGWGIRKKKCTVCVGSQWCVGGPVRGGR